MAVIALIIVILLLQILLCYQHTPEVSSINFYLWFLAIGGIYFSLGIVFNPQGIKELIVGLVATLISCCIINLILYGETFFLNFGKEDSETGAFFFGLLVVPAFVISLLAYLVGVGVRSIINKLSIK
jgi:hypothetical protein